MKTSLLVLILSATLSIGSTAALAGPGKEAGHDRPHAERGHQPRADGNQFRRDRSYAKPNPDAHAQRGVSRFAQGHRHDQGWSKHRPHRNYAWRAAPRPRYHDYRYRSTVRHYPRHAPVNGVSIILHGHF